MCAQFKISTRPRKEVGYRHSWVVEPPFRLRADWPGHVLAMSMNGASESGF